MQDLLAAARAAFENAHAPYSGFRVGAAVRSASGRIFAGANVENASYPEGNCAEASALAAMVAAGERTVAEALVLAAGPALCTPCGGCRQRLAEFAGPNLPIHLCDPRGLRRTVTLGELLPLSFALGETGPGGGSGDDPASALARIKARRSDFTPRVGLILGSGLGGVADGVEDATAIDYAELPGFPRPGVEGHAGRLVLGHLGGLPVACLQGRVHLYEGLPAQAVNVLPRTLKSLGCEMLILTNAAGSLRPEIEPGAIALIEDHINLLGQNPLVGPHDAAAGPRFPDMSEVYDLSLASGRAAWPSASASRCAPASTSRRSGPPRDSGRDPGVSRARRRSGRHVDGAGGDQRPPSRPQGARALDRYQPRRRPRGASAQPSRNPDPGRRRGRDA